MHQPKKRMRAKTQTPSTPHELKLDLFAVDFDSFSVWRLVGVKREMLDQKANAKKRANIEANVVALIVTNDVGKSRKMH